MGTTDTGDTTMVPPIPPEVAAQLGYYVYLYVDPRDGRPFYVGKGRHGRALAHLQAGGDSRKARVLAELRDSGQEPSIEVLAHGLKDEETALRIEAAVIDLLGLAALTNEVRGWKSVQLGRQSLSQLVSYYAAAPVDVTHACLLIRINKLYRHNITATELYEATRGVWELGPRREKAEYALAVFESVVRAAYRIDAWHPAGTTDYETRPAEDVNRKDRWEFVGAPAPDEIQRLYVGKSVKHYFKKGNRAPVLYFNA